MASAFPIPLNLPSSWLDIKLSCLKVCPREECWAAEKSSPEKSLPQKYPMRRKAHRPPDGCGEKLTYQSI